MLVARKTAPHTQFSDHGSGLWRIRNVGQLIYPRPSYWASLELPSRLISSVRVHVYWTCDQCWAADTTLCHLGTPLQLCTWTRVRVPDWQQVTLGGWRVVCVQPPTVTRTSREYFFHLGTIWWESNCRSPRHDIWQFPLAPRRLPGGPD